MALSVHLKLLAYFNDSTIRTFFIVDIYYKLGTNLTYLAPQDNFTPGQFFMGVKTFIGTPEMQRTVVLKDNLFEV